MSRTSRTLTQITRKRHFPTQFAPHDRHYIWHTSQITSMLFFLTQWHTKLLKLLFQTCAVSVVTHFSNLGRARRSISQPKRKRSAPGNTRPPIQCLLEALSPWGIRLITQLHLVPWLRISGALPICLYDIYRDNLTFHTYRAPVYVPILLSGYTTIFF